MVLPLGTTLPTDHTHKENTMTTEVLINARRVEEVLCDCLYQEEEIKEPGVPPEGAILVEGIVRKYGFHPDRLENHRVEVVEWLKALPDEFRDSGGGWSFLNACMDRNGNLWGEHPSMEALVCLGIGLGLVEFGLPRESWTVLPGGVPYFTIKVLS